jgi:hypothetical protein
VISGQDADADSLLRQRVAEVMNRHKGHNERSRG